MARKSQIRRLQLKSVTATLAIKCYEEQLPNGSATLMDSVKNTDKNEFQIIAINHSRSSEKDHWHIIVRAVDNKKRFQVESMLKRLSIYFREGQDDVLLAERGVETVGDFTSYATYLLHQTVEAKRDGKASYDIADIVSNLSDDEIKQILGGYSITKRAIRKNEIEILIDRAREAARSRINFYEFIDSLNITGLTEKQENDLRKAYAAGIRRLIEENYIVNRLNIRIVCNNNREMKNLVMDAACEALAGKRVIKATRQIKYNIDASTDAIVTCATGFFDSADDKVFLWNDGIVEIPKKNTSFAGVWAGDILVYIEPMDKRSRNGDTLTKRSGKFFGLEMDDEGITEISHPEAYYDDEEFDELQKRFKVFSDSFEDIFKIKKSML